MAGPETVPLRDLKPGYLKGGGQILYGRAGNEPGIRVLDKVYRGITVRSNARVGYDLDGCFTSLTVKVGVPKGSPGPVRFFVHGRGRVLLATSPIFPGQGPVKMTVPLDGVLLLELETKSERGGRAAWMEGVLTAVEDKDLGRFLAGNAPFDPGDYPVAFRRRVNEGINKATKYLLAQDPARAGEQALVVLALLKAGVPASHEKIRAWFARLEKWHPNLVYDASVYLMALEAKYFPGGFRDRSDRRKRAKELITKKDRARIAALADYLAECQGAGFSGKERALNPVWRYPGSGYDLSNTQYALFGLTAAARCGEDRPKVWLPAVRFILGAQAEKGPKVPVSRYYRNRDLVRRRIEDAEARGFGYTLSRPHTGSMTSAGLCSLVLCQQALYRNTRFRSAFHARTKRGIRDALAWLEEYYDLSQNTFGPRQWWVYYLFNVERVGVLLDQRYIGTRDWYQEGSELLLAEQQGDGRVRGGIVDTAFALLFWKRATVPARTTSRK